GRNLAVGRWPVGEDFSMITLRITGQRRDWNSVDDIEESWVIQQINQRRRAGEAGCVEGRIETARLKLSPATPAGRQTGGGGRLPNADERRVFTLWNERGLNASGFADGQLIAFLKQLSHLTVAEKDDGDVSSDLREPRYFGRWIPLPYHLPGPRRRH